LIGEPGSCKTSFVKTLFWSQFCHENTAALKNLNPQSRDAAELKTFMFPFRVQVM